MTRLARVGLLFLALTVAFASHALAQGAQGPQGVQPERLPAGVPPVYQGGPPAEAIRNQLDNLMEQYPPNLRRVLQLDPSLLNRPDYLAPYPRLVAFLQQYPEVGRNPSYFFGSLNDFRRGPDSVEVFAVVLAGIAVFTAVMTILAILTSLARQVIDYRRWLRQSRVQTEVHTKILDRLGSNEELLAYVQSPAGRHFLESSPITTEGEPRSVSAPLGRILWSVQLGVVLGTLGAGFWIVQQNMTLPPEIIPAFYVLAVIAVALGVGAVMSAVLAYFLSARLGLLPAQKPVA